jgi:Tfp pilus assembly protein FimT
MKTDTGLSLLEVLLVVAVLMVVSTFAVPVLLTALDAVRGLLALVNQVVVR